MVINPTDTSRPSLLALAHAPDISIIYPAILLHPTIQPTQLDAGCPCAVASLADVKMMINHERDKNDYQPAKYQKV